MAYDKKIADLFYVNFKESYRSAKLLLSSYHRIAHLMPLEGVKFHLLNADDLEKLDAFRVRYCDLQDSLGNKTFRSIVLLEEEIPGSNLDILNKMEKRKIIKSFEEWKFLRKIRNLFSHDYPETDEDKAEILYVAYTSTMDLLIVVDNIIQYMQRQFNFPIDSFPLLVEK
ncbi:MAG: hypothetical protein FJZ58_00695 [Chlamydiae bacterium]|nr:hypothetical protein [Chlamydiota bacterium]